MSKRLKRVSQQLQQELGDILIKEATDPNLRFVSITRVDVSADIQHAHVFITTFNNKTDKALKSLQKAKGMLKSELVKRVSFKYTPDLVFFEDKGIEHSMKINKMLFEMDIDSEDQDEDAEE